MIEYKYQNFYEFIDSHAKNTPKKKIIFSENGYLTNAQLKEKIDTVARFLELSGIKYKDKVALILENSEFFVISLFAITKIGAIAVPINNFLKKEEFEYILNDSNAKLLFASVKFQKELVDIFKTTGIEKIIWEGNYKNIDERNFLYDEILNANHHNEIISHIPTLDDTAIIIYTSGTTGHPKGAMLSFRNIMSNSISATKVIQIKPNDRFIVYLPMFHSFTLSIMVILPLFNNVSIVIVKSIFPFSNVLKQVLLKKVTIFLGAPQIYNALIKAKIPWYFMWFNKIRIFISGSAPLSEKTIKDFQKKFKKAKLLEGYGLSECSPAVCVNPLHLQKPLSVGLPLPGYEVKIVNDELVELEVGEIGEIIVKGDCVMQGYYNNEEATKNTIINRWLRTGDLGKVDKDGYVYIIDRIKDLIISKGINIYPREIEELIYKIEGVEAIAVIGIPDETKDEKIVAFIELKKDIDKKPRESEIKQYLKKHLANFKIPKYIYFIDKLPRNATNKVLKRKLKQNLNEYIKGF